LVKPCMLSVYWGIKEELAPSKKQLRIFESGGILENWWIQNVLRNTPGITIIATQLPARYMGDGWEIHGRIDCLCLENNKLIIREIKTAKTCSWMNKAKEDHRAQLNFYLCSLGVDLGNIDYIDKSVMLLGEDPRNPTLPPDTHYIIERNWDDYNYMIEIAGMLHEHVSTDNPPAPTPCWLCSGQNKTGEIYCDYIDKCPAHEHPPDVSNDTQNNDPVTS
jgi:hypothetical protein